MMGHGFLHGSFSIHHGDGGPGCPFDNPNAPDIQGGPTNSFRRGHQAFDMRQELEDRDEDTRAMYKGQGRIMTSGDDTVLPRYFG